MSPSVHHQEPCARLLLPSLFRLKNPLQRISSARNSQVSACVWIPSQMTLGWTLCCPSCSGQSCWPHLASGQCQKRLHLHTKVPEHTAFQSCQRADQSYTPSLWLKDLHPNSALALCSCPSRDTDIPSYTHGHFRPAAANSASSTPSEEVQGAPGC